MAYVRDTLAITADNIVNTDVEMDPIRIGAKRTSLSTGSNSFFAGIIDDVRWYQAALTGSVKCHSRHGQGEALLLSLDAWADLV